jgi:multidrug resistance efflux pump
LRAPLAGVLRLETFEPGAEVAGGSTLFRVENPRFGNVEAMSQLNWIQELVDRLRAEVDEAELRLAQQTELFKYQEALFRDKIISRAVYLEEESKVALCRIAVNSKKDQLRAAKTRSQGIEKQLALQKEAVTAMPFDGVVWSAHVQNGSEVGSQETVLHVVDPKRMRVDAFVHEKHTARFQVGTQVMVRAVDGPEAWTGRVESIRGGVGRLDPEQFIAAPPSDLLRRRVAVRIKLESANPFTASEFFGIGRSVKVTPLGHE